MALFNYRFDRVQWQASSKTSHMSTEFYGEIILKMSKNFSTFIMYLKKSSSDPRIYPRTNQVYQKQKVHFLNDE